MTHQKHNLPMKTGPACDRLFVLWKPWAKVWEQVEYWSVAYKADREI